MIRDNRSFKLSIVNRVLAVIIFILSGFLAVLTYGASHGMSFVLGNIFGVIIFPLIFAILVWSIRGRKEYSGTHTFNFFLILMFLSQLTSFAERINEIVIHNEMSEATIKYKNRINSEEDAIVVLSDYLLDRDKNLSKVVNSTTGNEKKIYIKIREFASVNSEITLKWQSAYDSILNPRILDYTLLNTPEEFDYQISVVEYYGEQSKLYKKYFESMVLLLDSLFHGIPSDNPTLIDVKRGAMKKYNLQKPIFDTLVEAHISYSENLIELLEFLKKNDELWEYENDEILFEYDLLLQIFLRIMDEIAEDENQINDLSDKLVETF